MDLFFPSSLICIYQINGCAVVGWFFCFLFVFFFMKLSRVGHSESASIKLIDPKAWNTFSTAKISQFSFKHNSMFSSRTHFWNRSNQRIRRMIHGIVFFLLVIIYRIGSQNSRITNTHRTELAVILEINVIKQSTALLITIFSTKMDCPCLQLKIKMVHIPTSITILPPLIAFDSFIHSFVGSFIHFILM